MAVGLFELTIILGIAAIFSLIARVFRQPLILAYLATGVVVAAGASLGLFEGIFHFEDHNTLHLFSDLGIMFLLFLVGLEVNYNSLRLVGRSALLLGIVQISITAVLGYALATALGFTVVASLYIGIALSFSSTIVIVKILSEKKEINSLYGKLSIGILLVQDFVAILVLVMLSGVGRGNEIAVFPIALKLIEAVVLFGIMIWLGRRVFPRLFDLIARSQELLFLFSLAWVFAAAAIAQLLGFSIEIGGFLAGLALANASEHYQIASRVRPLRDFFIVIFFVTLGSSLLFIDIRSMLIPIILFSLFVLIGDQLIVLTMMGLLGYTRRTSFMTAITIAQISEFSLVLATLGLSLGHIGLREVSLITTVGIITITTSTYMLTNSEQLFRRMKDILGIFERKTSFRDIELQHPASKKYVIIGFTRTGQGIAMHLKKHDLLIVDQDPEIIETLKKNGYAYLYGDASDTDLFDNIDLLQTEVLISTVPQLEDNLALLESIQRINLERGRHAEKRIITIARAEHDRDASLLYKMGANLVLMPHVTSGHYLGSIIAAGLDNTLIDQMRKREQELLGKSPHQTVAVVGEALLRTPKENRKLVNS